MISLPRGSSSRRPGRGARGGRTWAGRCRRSGSGPGGAGRGGGSGGRGGSGGGGGGRGAGRVLGAVVAAEQVVDHLLVDLAAEARRRQLEQPVELGLVGVGDVDLERDAAQERLVDQVARLQVGAEQDQLVEGDLDLLARG